jgi:hypothetical protein
MPMYEAALNPSQQSLWTLLNVTIALGMMSQ